jgi:hypothetical protein
MGYTCMSMDTRFDTHMISGLMTAGLLQLEIASSYEHCIEQTGVAQKSVRKG